MKPAKKKKGISHHHLFYGEKEIVVELPSKGSHLILTSFQRMSPTKQNIKWLKNYKRAVDYIIKEKEEKIGK
mgnify:CR=1 FL=1